MNWLVGAIPGLVIALCVVLLIRGYHMMRTDPDVGLEDADLAILSQSDRDRAKGQSAFDSLATKLAKRLRTTMPRQWSLWLQRQVEMAGRPDGMDVDAVLVKMTRWLLLLLPVIIIGLLRGQILLIVLAPAAAIVLPLGSLSGAAQKRRERIDHDLPDFLDVLAVTVSAGLGFRQALSTVSQRFGGPLADEIRTVLNQITNGASVRSAFGAMRDRTHYEAVDEFVTAYLQSEELGAPLVDTLNQIATDMRRASAQRLRQLASRIEPRISLVLTLVLVPGAMIFLIGGMAVVMMSNTNFGSLFGGG